MNRLLGLGGLALRRVRFYLGLSFLALVGVILAVGLVTSAGFFSQAVDTVVMRQELAEYSRITGQPPFSVRIFVASTPAVPLSLQRVQELGRGIARTLSDEVHLPAREVAFLANSGVLRLRARDAAAAKTLQTNVMVQDAFADHVEIVEGAAFDPAASSGDALDVWVHALFVDKTGAKVGDLFDLSTSSGEAFVPVRIAGVWRALDPEESYWFSKPDQSLKDALMVRPDDYTVWIEPLTSPGVRSANWRVVLDETKANPDDGRLYVEGFARAPVLIDRFLPDARVTTPSVPLEKFVTRQTSLTTLLLGFNVPGMGFLLYFLVLTSAVIAYWQRREIAILVSRGMGRLTVLNFSAVEALLLFLFGAPLGLAFGIGLARLMGYAASFLSFSDRPPLPVSLAGVNWRLIGLTLAIVLLARLWASALASRQSVVDQEREHVRPRLGPFWYRNYLDLLLVIPTVYAYDQLANQGSLAMLVQDRPEDLFQDPLLVLAPALFVVIVALLAMRPFPLMMRLLDFLANHSPWLPFHLALRQLGRQSHTYINPLLLVIVSLALGVYTFSMAASLDKWLADQVHYSVGADLAFTPYSETEALREVPGADWIPPADEFAAVPGVARATRVGDYRAEIRLAEGKVSGRFLGVDRVQFPETAWFRSDLAGEPLGALMNRLALAPENILVSEDFLAQNNLQIGDRLQILVITDYNASVSSQFTVAGVFTHFPTVYEDQVTVIGNLDYLFSFFPVAMPHRIWLRLEPGADGAAVMAAAKERTGIDAHDVQDAAAIIAEQQGQMERVGVFGTLTVSFIMSALMAALGLLTYSYASLNERMYHFSVLRAVGMQRRTVAVQVLLEYATLTAYGAVAGVAVGSYAAQLFVPLFRVGQGGDAPLPPLIPVIARGEILPMVIAFAGLMILLELVVLSSALYRRIFVALRMGYTG